MTEQYYYVNSTHRILKVETQYNGTLYYPEYYTTSFKKWVKYTEARQAVSCKTLRIAYKHIHASLRWLKAQGM